MSLILDALKKSDQNSHRGEIPDLQADHSSPVPLSRFRRWRVWWLLLALVLAAAVAIAAWQFWPGAALVNQPQKAQLQPIPAPQPTTAKPAEPAAAALKPAVVGTSAPAPAKPEPQKPKKSPAQQASAPASAPQRQTAAEVYKWGDLPSNIRQGLPELLVSLHYYSPEPEARMVRINNRILREGGELPGGIRIEAIESNGILCSAQGVRFRLPKTTPQSQPREANRSR